MRYLLWLIVLPAILFASPTRLHAQQEIGLHFMPRAWQSQQTNPAFFNEKTIVFSLPAAHMQLSNTGFSFDDVLQRDTQSDSLILNFDGVVDQLDAENFLNMQSNLDLLTVGVKLHNFQFGASAAVRGRGFLYYPRSLLELAWEGNGGRIGETVSIAPNFQAFGYAEIGLSAAYRVKDRVQFGLRLKHLSGLADISAGNHIAHLTTNPEYYQLNMVADYSVNTSVVSIGDSTGEPFAFRFSQNTGWAADLGLVVHLNEKLTSSASVLDIGSINWDEKVRNYAVKGSYNFEGMDVAGVVRGDSLSFESVMDTLKAVFDVVETTEAYRTRLPMRVYVSATFSPIESLRLSGAYFQEYYRGKHRTVYAVSASKDLGKIFTGGITYALRDRQFDNLGINALLKLGPFVLFGTTDNLMDLAKPRRARNLHIRWGTNFTF